MAATFPELLQPYGQIMAEGHTALTHPRGCNCWILYYSVFHCRQLLLGKWGLSCAYARVLGIQELPQVLKEGTPLPHKLMSNLPTGHF